jgi:hypothetical protein
MYADVYERWVWSSAKGLVGLLCVFTFRRDQQPPPHLGPLRRI